MGNGLSPYSHLNVLYATPTGPGYIGAALLSDRQVVCGPHWPDTENENGLASVHTPAGAYDLAAVAARLPHNQQPELVVVWTDATLSNLPRNLAAFSCPKVLVVGDTHHGPQPLRKMIQYAGAEPFQTLLTINNRQHIPLFREAGLPLQWLPGLNAQVFPGPFQEERRAGLVFVGQVGKWHPRRKYLLERLQEQGIPVQIGQSSGAEAARRYASFQASFHCTLNGDLSFRFFEVLSAGGFLLADALGPQSGLHELFRDGEHLVLYHSLPDLLDKARYFLAQPAAAGAIARRGFAEFWRRHSPEIKRRELLDLVFNGRLPAAYQVPNPVRRVMTGGFAPSDKSWGKFGIYEYVQELRGRQEEVSLLLSPGLDPGLVAALTDFPRLRSVLWQPEDEEQRAKRQIWDLGIFPLPVALSLDLHCRRGYRCSRLVVTEVTTDREEILLRRLSLAGYQPEIMETAESFQVFRLSETDRRLNIGGLQAHPLWEIFSIEPGRDVDHAGDARDLSRFPAETFGEIYASHVLEHFAYYEVLPVLKEWEPRVLRPGGRLRLSVPDMDKLAALYLDKQRFTVNDRYVLMIMLFGGQTTAHDCHYAGLNEDFLRAFLEVAGFPNVQVVTELGVFDDTSKKTFQGSPISLNIVAIKGGKEVGCVGGVSGIR